MRELPPALRPPEAPDYAVPWDALQSFDQVRALEGCVQDPIHHAEGDVWIHTRMVLETLVGLPAWRALDAEGRAATWLGCLLHDVGKPATTRTEPDGRVTSRGHSRVGDRMTRRLLWELGVPYRLREEVCGLVRFHQIPFFLLEREDPRRLAIELSYACRADRLALVAEADIRGRECRDMGRIVDAIELFRTFCEEEGCLDRPRPFPDDVTRITYWRSTGRFPDAPAHDDTRAELTMMVGLPGSGKDTWVAEHAASLPKVSLDDLRAELDVDPGSDQGRVRQACTERLREHLRRGESFVYVATNLDRQRRAPILALAADYRFRVKIVSIEVPEDVLYAQNQDREAVVPERVVRAMLDRWEAPNRLEAHRLCVVER